MRDLLRQIRQIFRISGTVDLFSPKNILILLKNFLNFWFDAVELQNIINLSCDGSMGYVSVVLGNSEVTFLVEREDEGFFQLSLVFWLYTALQYRSSKSSNFLTLLVFHQNRQLSCFFLIFDRTTSSSRGVNCSRWMSSCLLIIFVINLSVTLGNFPNRFLKCSFYMCVRYSRLATFSLALEVLFL